jgi:nucleotide-binding universal stress UspA family protein
VGYNGSASADLALAWAVKEAGSRQRPVRLVYVADRHRPDRFGALSGSAHDLMRLRTTLARVAASSRQRTTVVVNTSIVDGCVVDCLCAVADGADLIVLGAGSLGATDPGSTAHLIEAMAPCPTMIIRTGERPSSPLQTYLSHHNTRQLVGV